MLVVGIVWPVYQGGEVNFIAPCDPIVIAVDAATPADPQSVGNLPFIVLRLVVHQEHATGPVDSVDDGGYVLDDVFFIPNDIARHYLEWVPCLTAISTTF